MLNQIKQKLINAGFVVREENKVLTVSLNRAISTMEVWDALKYSNRVQCFQAGGVVLVDVK